MRSRPVLMINTDVVTDYDFLDTWYFMFGDKGPELSSDLRNRDVLVSIGSELYLLDLKERSCTVRICLGTQTWQYTWKYPGLPSTKTSLSHQALLDVYVK